MTTLPLELVPAIFQAVADSEVEAPHAWWAATDTYHMTFDAFSLVSKAWRKLSHPYRGFYTLEPSLEGSLVEDRPINFARNGDNLAESVPIRALDIQDIYAPDLTEASSHLHTMLLDPSTFQALTSLSMDLDLLDHACYVKQDYPILNLLEELTKKVNRLHLRSHTGHYCIRNDHDPVTGSSIHWSELAGVVWPNGKACSLQELSLATLNIWPSTAPDTIRPSPVKSLITSDVYCRNRTKWSRLFPEVERLVLQQTVAWVPHVPAFNMIFDIGKNLQHLHLIWAKAPYPLLASNSDILKSPNLEMIHIEAGPGKILDNALTSDDILVRMHKIFEAVKSLKELTIEGIDLLGSNEDVAAFCAAFASETYLPKLVAIPKLTLHYSEKEIKFDLEKQEGIAAGLAGLQGRGLYMHSDLLAKTVWNHQTE